jgi:hypothetical protein
MGSEVLVTRRHWWSKFWGHHPIPESQRGEAERQLERIQAQAPEVHRVAKHLESRQGDNHFREAMEQAFRGDG